MLIDILSQSNIVIVIGVAAGVLTAISMMPQVIKTIRTKKAEHVSPFMLIILLAGVALWIAYGVLKSDSPIIITNSFSLLVNTVMLYLRWRYKNN